MMNSPLKTSLTALAILLIGFLTACSTNHPTTVTGKPDIDSVSKTSGPAATTYYIDSLQGQNGNAGTSPSSAWKDFTPINGKTLQAGERLLIRRGSVINQELTLSACGTATNWVEIGAYGSGPRPIIRRNWFIGDRCVLVKDPDYLRIRSLVVCNAGKGLVVCYNKPGHAGLVIDDCIAQHIEGLYRPNSSGIPEWRDYVLPTDDHLHSSAGFAITGATAKELVIKNCECTCCSWGFFVKGEQVTIDRVYCHANYAYNTSPHPALVAAYHSTLQNCIFDAPGWHAHAGTMGIMLCDPQGLTIRNCTFRNQPDSGSHDEGGIDFEARGDGCVIDGCTFENNAGAGIEVLGLKSPQPKNVEIKNSRFIKNNWAKKLGPAEIFIWGRGNPPNPKVCMSNGSIHDNAYVLNPGVQFFTNEAPALTQWTLQENRQFDSVEALEKAMPYNHPPRVTAGHDLRTDRLSIRLDGSVSDDRKPAGNRLSVRWEQIDGPGTVLFRNETDPKTTATFPVTGDYLLRLVADDGELWLCDRVHVHVLPPHVTVAKAWEFNTNLEKEGWSELNTGTRMREEKDALWPCKSYPVNYVAGGYYIVAIEESPYAQLISADNLKVDISRATTIRIRFQNHTPASRMKCRFTTTAAPAWDDAKCASFEVTANDNGPRDYCIDMSKIAGWNGSLKQLRLDLATGTPLTGTCRIDYLWIDNSKPVTP